MLAVSLPEQQARDMLLAYPQRVWLAAINAPSAVTLVGEQAALEEIARTLTLKEVFSRFLKLSYAFHSPVMERIREELLISLQGLCPQPSSLPFISTVTGLQVDGPECTADYWYRNVRCPVLFQAGMQQLIEQEYSFFLEMSPHPVLSGYVTACLAEQEGRYPLRSIG